MSSQRPSERNDETLPYQERKRRRYAQLQQVGGVVEVDGFSPSRDITRRMSEFPLFTTVVNLGTLGPLFRQDAGSSSPYSERAAIVPANTGADNRLGTETFADTVIADAIRNYAFFYKLKRSQVTAKEIVRSSAGIEGWASANLGFVDRVLTLHFAGKETNGEIEIECTSAGGTATRVKIWPSTTVATLRSSLAHELQLEADLLQLVMPDSRLLSSADETLDEMRVLDLHASSQPPSAGIQGF